MNRTILNHVHLRVMAFLCLLTFMLDAILTYVGIEFHGGTEGNLILSYLMQHFGVALTLIVSRVFGVCCLYYVVSATERTPEQIPTICLLLAFISIVYIWAAIIPWAKMVGI